MPARSAKSCPNRSDQPQLVVRYREFDGEISLPGPLINQTVGGQSGQLPFKIRQGALVQAGEPDQRALSDLEIFGVIRRDARLDAQRHPLRNDVHQLLVARRTGCHYCVLRKGKEDCE
jgi:hypothetical protein